MPCQPNAFERGFSLQRRGIHSTPEKMQKQLPRATRGFRPRPNPLFVVLICMNYLLSSAAAFHAGQYFKSSHFTRLSARQKIRKGSNFSHHCNKIYGICLPSSTTSLSMSSIGGGDDDNRSNYGDGKNDDDDNPLNEWIQRKESENLRRARENLAEGRLPISYGAMKNNSSEEGDGDLSGGKFGPLNPAEKDSDETIDSNTITGSSSSLARSSSPNEKPAKQNPYLAVVSNLTPSDLIARFTSTASPRVQDAVRTTILGLIGGLPQMAFETKTIATGERLASLMFQLQMTGYMFKNAEYRLSLSQSLGRAGDLSRSGVMATRRGSNLLMPGEDVTGDEKEEEREWRDGKLVNGKIKVRYGGSYDGSNSGGKSGNESSSSPSTDDVEQPTTPGLEIEVDAKAYMSELRTQVDRLREELDATKQAKEEEIRKDLLLYIRTLPQQELRELTSTMSPEVLEAMKGLVTAVLAGIGEGDVEGGKGQDAEEKTRIGPNTVTEQSGEALAQLCMWQLVVGFNLRELEVREEIRASLRNVLGDDTDSSDGEESGVDFGPGALE